MFCWFSVMDLLLFMLRMNNIKLIYGLADMRSSDDQGGCLCVNQNGCHVLTLFQTNLLIKCIYICKHLPLW